MEQYLPLIYSNSIEYDPLVNVDFTETFTRNASGNSNQSANLISNSSSESSSDSSSSNSQNQISNVTNQGTNSSNSSNLQIENKTPQGRINKQNLDSGAYASNVNQNDIQDSTTNSNTQNASDSISSQASQNVDNSTSIDTSQSTSATNTNSSLEQYTRKQKGNSGSLSTAQKLIEQYRKNIIAIDKEIISELNILFFGLF